MARGRHPSKKAAWNFSVTSLRSDHFDLGYITLFDSCAVAARNLQLCFAEESSARSEFAGIFAGMRLASDFYDKKDQRADALRAEIRIWHQKGKMVKQTFGVCCLLFMSTSETKEN